MHARTFVLGLLSALACATAGCDGSAPPGDGTSCASSDECDETTVCVLGRCRDECDGYRDCRIGSRCLVDPETGASACRLPDESECTDTCPDGTECQDGRCIAQCETSATCGGTECVDGACEEPDATRVTCDDIAYCAAGICDDVDCDDDVALSAGGLVTCTVRTFGDVDCAGSDRNGTLGDGLTEHENGVSAFLQPVILADLAQAVAAGAEHACAQLVSGEVDCWGLGDRGQTGAAGTVDLPAMVIAPEADETRQIFEIVAGSHHTCVRRASGAIECWGDDASGQLGDAADHPACAGSAACSTAPVVVEGLVDALRIDASEGATCALRETGAIACWGRADTGIFAGATEGLGTCTALGGATSACRTTPMDIAGIERATAVTVGATHACAIDEDGFVWCWGGNESGQAGTDSEAIAIPTMVDTPMAALVIDAGRAHTCALLVDDQVWCWGANDQAQRGEQTSSGGARPTQVPGLPRIVDLVSGIDHVCARTIDGEIWCWGRDVDAQLADGAPGTAGESPPRRALRTLPGGP